MYSTAHFSFQLVRFCIGYYGSEIIAEFIKLIATLCAVISSGGEALPCTALELDFQRIKEVSLSTLLCRLVSKTKEFVHHGADDAVCPP